MKTCIITGAGTGIGQATAVALAADSEYRAFALLSIGMDGLEETKRLMLEKGSEDMEIVLYDQDLTQYQEVDAVVEDIDQHFGSIDALLNVAGYSKECPFFEIELDLFKRTFEINVFALFYLTQCVARRMKGKGGVVVNVASTSGSTPRPGWLPYAASKSAVISISRTLTYELKEHGIKLFNISPGRCATAMRRDLRPNEDASVIMQPETVGNMIAFCVKHPDSCIDGQDIIVRQFD